MTPRRITLLFLVLVAACATSKDVIIARTLAGVDAAHAAFEAMDARREADLVATATSHAAGEAKLTAHRKVTDKIEDGFIAAWSAIALASLDRSDANLGRMVQIATEAMVAFRGWRP